jgi:integrase
VDYYPLSSAADAAPRKGTTVTPATAAAVRPCKKHGNAERNRFGHCVLCQRERNKNYAQRERDKAKAAALPAPAPAAAPAPLTVTPPAPGLSGPSFLDVAREWLASQDDLAPATTQKRAYLLEQLKALHGRAIAGLRTPDYVRALEDIQNIGDRRETAHRAAMLAGQITRYALNKGYTENNPLPAGQLRGTLKPVRVESHAAVTDPKGFGELLRGIDTYIRNVRSRNHPSVAAALRIAPYLFVRPGELRSMEWSEINFERAEWLIPAEKMKMRRPHLVPLAPQAVAILREQHAVTGTGRYVFPQKRRDEPLSENAFREAFRIVELITPEAHTMHGFRSSASTMLNGELHVDSALVELQLAHVKGDRVAGIYDRSQRVEERRDMMQRWANYIDELRASE